jgi:hypothetical protein
VGYEAGQVVCTVKYGLVVAWSATAMATRPKRSESVLRAIFVIGELRASVVKVRLLGSLSVI